jgi:hypothetical protein
MAERLQNRVAFGIRAAQLNDPLLSGSQFGVTMLQQADAAVPPVRISTLVEQIIHVKCLMRAMETTHADMHNGLTDFLPVMIGCEQAMVSGTLCEPFSAHKAARLGIRVVLVRKRRRNPA